MQIFKDWMIEVKVTVVVLCFYMIIQINSGMEAVLNVLCLNLRLEWEI